MNELETTYPTKEQEEELLAILIGSSLFQSMPEKNKQMLLHYLVDTYFNHLPGENSRALPKAMKIVPAKSIGTY